MEPFEALRPGDPERVGPYRIVARLGTGGMGQVFLGQSRGGRSLAVKVLRPELAKDHDFRQRFVREVDSARRVNGVFTAGVVDADPEGTPAWLATAYVPGIPLSTAIIEYGPWSEESTLALAAALAEALEAIHAADVVHRDLKPSNVLLAPDGPRVIDFGISLPQGSGLTEVTTVGLQVGTPGFMSPEQLKGEPVGPASDVFSLGSVLTFVASGTGPFGSGSLPEITFRIVYQDPRLDALPSGLREVVARCLAKEPDERPSVSAVLDELAPNVDDGDREGAATSAGADWLPEAVAQAVSAVSRAPKPSGGPADTTHEPSPATMGGSVYDPSAVTLVKTGVFRRPPLGPDDAAGDRATTGGPGGPGGPGGHGPAAMGTTLVGRAWHKAEADRATTAGGGVDEAGGPGAAVAGGTGAGAMAAGHAVAPPGTPAPGVPAQGISDPRTPGPPDAPSAAAPSPPAPPADNPRKPEATAPVPAVPAKEPAQGTQTGTESGSEAGDPVSKPDADADADASAGTGAGADAGASAGAGASPRKSGASDEKPDTSAGKSDVAGEESDASAGKSDDPGKESDASAEASKASARRKKPSRSRGRRWPAVLAAFCGVAAIGVAVWFAVLAHDADSHSQADDTVSPQPASGVPSRSVSPGPSAGASDSADQQVGHRAPLAPSPAVSTPFTGAPPTAEGVPQPSASVPSDDAGGPPVPGRSSPPAPGPRPSNPSPHPSNSSEPPPRPGPGTGFLVPTAGPYQTTGNIEWDARSARITGSVTAPFGGDCATARFTMHASDGSTAEHESTTCGGKKPLGFTLERPTRPQDVVVELLTTASDGTQSTLGTSRCTPTGCG